MIIPANLNSNRSNPDWQNWLSQLPHLVSQAEARWDLTVAAPFEPGGQTAWVAPATAQDGRSFALKIGWPHFESEHEAQGLRLWAGRPVVQLIDEMKSPFASVLLLERCDPGAALSTRPPIEQDEVIAGLMATLWVTPPPGHTLGYLTDMCDRWADAAAAKEPAPDLDPGLMRTGLELFRSLPRDAEITAVIASDLHAGNVLAAQRLPWLVIDPKPVVGDPTYDAIQHMLNRHDALMNHPLDLVQRMADLAQLDAHRLRLWLFARCVIESPRWIDLVPVIATLAP